MRDRNREGRREHTQCRVAHLKEADDDARTKRATLWPRVKDETRIERTLESCEKENRSLKALVVHLSEMVIRHIASKR